VTPKNRLQYVDGLRGIAVLMVVLCHSVWQDMVDNAPRPHLFWPRGWFDAVAAQGYLGVGMFLVVSGFCLSYPAWKRRSEGQPGWFDPRTFFARRCLRILPPYYAVLALLCALTLVLSGHATLPPSMEARPLNQANVLAHVLLLQNMTRWADGISGSFWSLGLEWQWYWVFPAVLALAARSLRAALVLCLLCAVGWHLGMGDLLVLWHHSPVTLPQRLFEFACGVAAARVVAERRLTSGRARLGLALCLFAPILAIVPGPVSMVVHEAIGPVDPVWGIAFAALVVLGSTPGRLNSLLSLPPLVRLGIISYGVYLTHQPVVEAVEMALPGPLHAYWR
jgi:peptidoglycan/LPS O-acetylase OafA/YrhL